MEKELNLNFKLSPNAITKEEKEINSIFEKTDEILFSCIKRFQKFNEVYKEEIRNPNDLLDFTKEASEVFLISLEKIQESNKIIMNIFRAWIKNNQIFEFFYNFFKEHLYLANFIFYKMEKIFTNKLDFNENIKIDNPIFFEFRDIVNNIHSLLDKIAIVFVKCNFAWLENEKKDRIIEIKKQFYQLSFGNIKSILKKLINKNIEIEVDDFLLFNEKIVNTKYWINISRPLRNHIQHKYIGYDEGFNSNNIGFIFINFYIAIRSLWYLYIPNLNTEKALKNIDKSGLISNSYNGNWDEVFELMKSWGKQAVDNFFIRYMSKNLGGILID